MKQLKTIILSTILSIALLLTATPAMAFDVDNDSIDISLLTCGPGSEVWSEFGHTAVRIHDITTGADVAVNYGMFSSNTPHFIPKFILGLTDYWVDVTPFDEFLAEYTYEGRSVIEQRLNITPSDKAAIIKAIDSNIRPENKVYRYNFFYDNCTTRARDIIVGNLSGKVSYPPAEGDTCTYRAMLHRWTKDYPWTQFGEDLLLGIGADRPTTKAQQQFLPDNLRADFDRTVYNGHPLVVSSQMILMAQPHDNGGGFPLTPLDMAMILFVVTIALEIAEHRKKKIFWGIDVFYMLLTGLAGLIITTMIFSEHPTVRVNLLILILNPLPLVALIPAIRKTIAHSRCHWWTVWEILTVAFIIGGFFQHYPSGMIVLAFILLTRPLMHHYFEKKIYTNK